MKRKLLLVEESVTVQKVVALTLDRSLYQIAYAKSRAEAIKMIPADLPHLVLASEQVGDLNVASFPREVEALCAGKSVPPLVLITTQDIHEAKSYAAVIRKPFSPQTLQDVVARFFKDAPSAPQPHAEEFEARRLESVFNRAFADEAQLVRETLDEAHEIPTAEPYGTDPFAPTARPVAPAAAGSQPPTAPMAPASPGSSLWDTVPGTAFPHAQPLAPATPFSRPQAPVTAPAIPFPGAQEASPGARHTLFPHPASPLATGRPVDPAALEIARLEKRVDEWLNKMLPPIVERMVKERLDALLKEGGPVDPLADLKS